jgi:hypothetical protein
VEICRHWQFAVAIARVGVNDNLADVVGLDGNAPGAEGETVAGTHGHVGEYLDAARHNDRVKFGAGLRDQESGQHFPSNAFALWAVFRYIEHWKSLF